MLALHQLNWFGNPIIKHDYQSMCKHFIRIVIFRYEIKSNVNGCNILRCQIRHYCQHGSSCFGTKGWIDNDHRSYRSRSQIQWSYKLYILRFIDSSVYNLMAIVNLDFESYKCCLLSKIWQNSSKLLLKSLQLPLSSILYARILKRLDITIVGALYKVS